MLKDIKKGKIVSIFSGIDCLGLGFREYFDTVLAVEQMKKACETLELNKEMFHPNMKVVNQNIFEIKDEFIKKYYGVDGLIGGPPCQPFSCAKNQFDPNDERISGLAEYVRWARIIKPKFFLFENTDGLTTKNKKHILDSLVEQLENLNYTVYQNVLNSHDYGSAQKRKRVILVGFRKALTLKSSYNFPKPIPMSNRKYVKDIIVPGEEIGECLKYSEERKFIVSHIPEGGNWKNITDPDLLKRAMGANATKIEGGMTGAYRRLSMKEGYCCPTITTNPCQRNTMAIHPTEDRPLSVKEYMRAQGIPLDYKLIGSINDKYKFIGNGVPVEMASALARSISEFYTSVKCTKSLPKAVTISNQESIAASIVVKTNVIKKESLNIELDTNVTQLSFFG